MEKRKEKLIRVGSVGYYEDLVVCGWGISKPFKREGWDGFKKMVFNEKTKYKNLFKGDGVL